MNHNEKIKRICSNLSENGYLRSRESTTIEFKESFNSANTAEYGKAMASFANNKGGYIIFGISDTPRRLIGLKNNKFDNLKQDKFTEAINSLFSPAIDWECGITDIVINKYNNEADDTIVKVGWIYTQMAVEKPVIALKVNNNENISSGDVFYRYYAQNQKIKFAEMNKIIEERCSNERKHLLNLFNQIQKADTASLGIVNYKNGKLSTPNGVDLIIDKKIVVQVLKKAKFIKEGQFDEKEGAPVIKVTGDINLAEEVPVPEGDPNETHPYIQKELAEKLNVSQYEVKLLVWYFNLKKNRKYHLAIRTSKKSLTHKFSQHALDFLKQQLDYLNDDPDKWQEIKNAYKNRDGVLQIKTNN